MKAAEAKLGVSQKRNLTCSPFTRELEYGKDLGGYWSYESMVIQLEDCVDCMKALYPDHDIIFLFDHSCGHDRLQPNGLSSVRINKNFGGKQPKMRSSKLTDVSLFGPYHSPAYKLQLGDTQSMVFIDGDIGPFYLSEEERRKRMFDVSTGEMSEKKILKKDLIAALKTANIVDPRGTTEQLQEQCKRLGLPITYQENKIIEGWVGKAKGAFQVLYEQGWIDPENISGYTEKGKMDDMGILLEDTSIGC